MDKTRIAAEFDAKAETYESNRLAPWYTAQSQYLLDGLNGLSLPAGDILDIGCATGWLARQLARRHADRTVFGVDLAPGMIRVATGAPRTSMPANLRFLTADWEAGLPSEVASRRFALITCASTFHYFAAPMDTLRRIRDHLAPDGLFVLVERDTATSPLTALWDLAHRWLIKDQVVFYSSAHLSAMLKQAGFSSAQVSRRIRRLFWHGKLQTSVVIVHARNTVQTSTRPAK